MSFLCPTRVKRDKKLKGTIKPLTPAGRITGSTSLDTLVQVEAAKQSGTEVRMVVIQDFEPCVSDETRVSRGQQIKVLYQENDWLFVVTPEGKEGFVPYSYCLPLERSIDDFAELLQKKKEKELTASTGATNSLSPSAPVEGRRSKRSTKSVPDIAQGCEFRDNQSVRSKGSRRSSRRGNAASDKITNKEEQTPRLQEWDALPWEDERFGRRSTRSLHITDNTKSPVKQRSRSLDRGERTQSVRVDPGITSSQVISRHHTFNEEPDDFSHHVYANDDVLKTLTSRSALRRQNKPDILPASTESVNTSSSRVSLVSGSSWRNLSTRSAPNCGTNSSRSQNHHYSRSHSSNISQHQAEVAHIQRSVSYQLQHSSQRHEHQSESPLGYTTAQVTCDYFKPSSQVEVSSFAKSDRGRHVVVYDYEAQDEGDLTLQQGDVVHVLNTDDPDWFWVVDEDDHEGFVPASFVQLAREYQPNITELTMQTSPPAVRSNHQRSVSFPAGMEYSPPDPSPRSAQPEETSTNTRLVCLYNYVAQSDKHLSMARGDWLYTNLDDQKNDNWLWVYSPKKRRSGFVPRSYVKAPNFGFHGSPVGNDSGDVTNIRAVDNVTLDTFISR